MNKGRIIKEFPENVQIGDAMTWCDENGWKLSDHCEGRNALGLVVLYTRGTALAGIVRHGDGFALVEVIR